VNDSGNRLRWQAPTFAGIAVRIGVGLYPLWENANGVDTGGLAFLAGLTAFSCLPYGVTYFLTTTNATRGAAAATAALAADLFGVYSGLIRPQGSTGALAVVFMPLWNLILIIPIAFVVSTFIQRSHKHQRDTA
jgi:hypothetical protein